MTEYPRFDHFDEFYVWRDFYLASFLLPISGDPKRAEHELIKQMLRFELDPLAAALYIWDWGHDELTGCRLENWQIEAFCRLRDHLTTPKTRHQPFKLAIASGHGIGKSAFLSMLNIVMLSTFPGTRIFNTANTEGQLLNKTWPEVSKWHKTAITSHWFVYTATALSTHGDDSKNWRSDAITGLYQIRPHLQVRTTRKNVSSNVLMNHPRYPSKFMMWSRVPCLMPTLN